jgi:hypothetical protein
MVSPFWRMRIDDGVIGLLGIVMIGGFLGYLFGRAPETPTAARQASTDVSATRQNQLVKYTGTDIYLCEEPYVRVCMDVNRNPYILRQNTIVRVLGEITYGKQEWVHLAIDNSKIEGWVTTNFFSVSTTVPFEQ